MPRHLANSAAQPDFPRAFRTVRVARKVSQEQFAAVSSRVYVSLLERGLNAPTLEKVDSLVRAMGLHPMTVLALTYAESPTAGGLAQLFHQIEKEVAALGLNGFSMEPMPRGRRRREEV